MVEDTIRELFYVCGVCGCLVSRGQEAVHENFHDDTRTGAIQIAQALPPDTQQGQKWRRFLPRFR